MIKEIMKKVLLILFFTLPLSMMAQMFMSSNQQLVEEAIKNGIVIVRQSYQLEDTVSNQRFGRYGNEEFGKTYSLGVKVDGGIVLNNKAICPWNYDENFVRYQDTHRPVNIKTEIRELKDSIFSNVKLNIDSIASDDPIANLPDSIIFSGNGFDVFSYSKPTDGWIVWITSSEEIQHCDSVGIEAPLIYKKKIEFNTDSVSYPIERPQTQNKVWGGIFVVPEQTEIGQLTFKLAGVMTEKDGGNWVLYPIKKESIIEMSPNTGDELTPSPSSSTESNKKKKNNKKKKK